MAEKTQLNLESIKDVEKPLIATSKQQDKSLLQKHSSDSSLNI